MEATSHSLSDNSRRAQPRWGWQANQHQRRGRLDQAQLAALAELGMHWAM
ncbi:hypothetical protein [Streptomyces sp. NPDC054849]